MRSMTGYGRCQRIEDGRDLAVEMKSVNHRYLDLAFRMPRELAFLEEPLRGLIAASGVSRGHVDVTVAYRNARQDAREVAVDARLVDALSKALSEAARESGLNENRDALQLAQAANAISVVARAEDADAVTALALACAREAITQLNAMRAREGASLTRGMAENLASLRAFRERIAARAPALPAAYRERLLARLRELDAQGVDAQRVAQEVALMADRVAIDEELDRLLSHFAQIDACFQSDDAVGRKLDFLIQELNREFNTIGSKAMDAEITGCVVDAKCEIEKLREQAQNIV